MDRVLSIRRALVAGSVLAWLATALPVHARDSGQWREEAPMLVGRSFTEAAVLADGRVLVPGGNHVHHLGATVPEAEIFDPATGTWSPTTPMVSPHAKHTVTALDDGRVLVETNAATLLPDGRVLVVAGATVRSDGARDVTNAAQLYDPRTNR